MGNFSRSLIKTNTLPIDELSNGEKDILNSNQEKGDIIFNKIYSFINGVFRSSQFSIITKLKKLYYLLDGEPEKLIIYVSHFIFQQNLTLNKSNNDKELEIFGLIIELLHQQQFNYKIYSNNLNNNIDFEFMTDTSFYQYIVRNYINILKRINQDFSKIPTLFIDSLNNILFDKNNNPISVSHSNYIQVLG